MRCGYNARPLNGGVNVLTRTFFLSLVVAAGAAAHSAFAAVELTDAQRAEIEARISPVGEVCLKGEVCGGAPKPTSGAPAAGAAVAAVDGETTYNGACAACHNNGVAGAPVVGNQEQWEPRIAKGMDALYDSGLNGVTGGAMLAKGGRSDLSDEAVKAAVDYMVENSQ